MCGRYRLSRRKQAIDEFFSTDPTGADWVPRYNIAPTQSVPVVRQNPKQPIRTLSLVRWGLVPSWTKSATIGGGVINARAETAAASPASARLYVEGVVSFLQMASTNGSAQQQANNHTASKSAATRSLPSPVCGISGDPLMGISSRPAQS